MQPEDRDGKVTGHVEVRMRCSVLYTNDTT